MACLDCIERQFLLGFDRSRELSLLQQYGTETIGVIDIVERLDRNIQLSNAEQRILESFVTHSQKVHFILPNYLISVSPGTLSTQKTNSRQWFAWTSLDCALQPVERGDLVSER